MELKDLITALTALVGMVLGIYNFLHARSADRVRLKVTPRASSYQGTGPDGREFYFHSRDRYDLNHPTSPPDTLSLEIVNLSKFPVTIDQAGLTSFWKRHRLALVNPILRDGKPWPRRLEPRETVTMFFDTTQLIGLPRLGSVKYAYAETECGTTCFGKSGALREFIRIARDVA